MRAGGLRSRRAAARAQENDRLFGLGGGPGKGAPVAEVLAVERDHLRRLVLPESSDQLGDVEIGLIAEGDDSREAEADLRCQPARLQREIPALRNESDRTSRKAVRGELEPTACVEDAEAVRAEEDGSVGSHALHDGPLAGSPRLAALAEACGDPNQRLRAGLERPLDGPLEPGGGNGDDDELGRLGKLGERAVGPMAEHVVPLSVHEVDGPAILSLERAAGEPVAPLGGVVRGAEDRDRAGIEQRPQVARHRCSR